MTKEKNFGFLGNIFQIQLLNNIILYKDFANSIVEVIDPKYFDNQYFKLIMQMIKEYYIKYEHTPSFDTLEQIANSEVSSETLRKMVIDTITQIKDAPHEGHLFVQEKSLKFCKQQELQRVMTDAQKIIDKGDFESYDRLEEMVRDALQVGEIDTGTADVFSGLEEVLADDFRHPIPMGIPGLDNLLKGGLAKGEIGVILAPTGVGKSQPLSEKILTPDGWVTMGDIKLGDRIIGSDGKEQYIIGVYPQGKRPIYNIEFTDNTSVMCDKEHLWNVNTLNMRTAKTRIKGRGVYVPNLGYKTMKTSDMIGNIKKRGRHNYRIPVVEPIEFNKKEISVDPYLLGVLLGDGCLTNPNPTISTKDDEIFDNISQLNEHTAYTEYEKNDTKTIKVIRLKTTVGHKLFEYELTGKKSNNKFIPNDYLYNTVSNRLSLLQGLMDTDGYVDKTGTCQITTVSEQLSQNIRELVLSLGGTVRINTKSPKHMYNGEKKTGQLAYIVTISFANDIIPFKMLRKVNRFRKREKYIEQKYIQSITYSHDEEAACIKVSNPDELYVTNDYVLTHNTTILTKLANNAFNLGYNVLQIFFEDNPKIIQRKHFTAWTNIAPDNLSLHKEEVITRVRQIQDNAPNKLILKKLPSDTVTINHIKNQVRKMTAEGNKIDLVILDYIDCIVPHRETGDEWKSEGAIMRGFESMCHELDIAGWTATQGNRQSISSELVTTDQMGGSIKKAQVGHVIITVAKSLMQKEMNLATIAVTKSRIGKDGIVFENCKFDNEMLLIDTDESITFLGIEDQKEEKNRKRVKDLIEKRKQREGAIQ